MSAKALLISVLAAGAVAAQAQVVFSNISASYTLNPGPSTFAWQTFPDSTAGIIDFVSTADPFKVGAGTGYSTGTSTVSYSVTSTLPITSITMVLQGSVFHSGGVNYLTTVSDNVGSLGSVSGLIQGSDFGGVDGAFTLPLTINFSRAVTSFDVQNMFAIDINGNSLPSESIASIGLIEQNMRTTVPEPASLAAIGLGLAAFLRKRRA